jgi:hypothetical protein
MNDESEEIELTNFLIKTETIDNHLLDCMKSIFNNYENDLFKLYFDLKKNDEFIGFIKLAEKISDYNLRVKYLNFLLVVSYQYFQRQENQHEEERYPIEPNVLKGYLLRDIRIYEDQIRKNEIFDLQLMGSWIDNKFSFNHDLSQLAKILDLIRTEDKDHIPWNMTNYQLTKITTDIFLCKGQSINPKSFGNLLKRVVDEGVNYKLPLPEVIAKEIISRIILFKP